MIEHSNNSDSSKRKRKEAAKKAWETIRKKKMLEKQKSSESVLKIDNFIPPKQMAKIKHPEDIFPLKPEKIPTVTYRNAIIRLFHKTPTDIVCGKFWELRWAYGCPLNCAYCYLRGTYKGKTTPRYVKLDHILGALDEVFNDEFFNEGKLTIFNTGELADSLMNPRFMEKIADKFEEQSKHKLLILTKFGTKNIDFLLKNPRKQTICAWSLNAPKDARLWEANAPEVQDRIEAARLVKGTGYRVWIRIDPVFPIEDWQDHYELLLLKMFQREVKPDRIILGTPRGLWKTIHYAKKAGVDMLWTKFFEHGEKTGWGLKLPFDLRKSIYVFIGEKLKDLGYDINKLSICKETIQMWEVLKWKYYPGECQCYGNHVLTLY